jgi:TRAP-type mannitol/chloroaromatic compound transport system substrate-binding protein
MMPKWINTTLVAALMLGTSTAVSHGQTRWTVTTQWPTHVELIEYDRRFLAIVEDLLGEELLIDFHDGGALVPPMGVFEAVSTGDVQASGDWPGFWAGRNSAFSPLGTHTMLFNAADYLMWISEWGGFDLYQEVYGQHNIVYLPHAVLNNESGFRTNRPIESLEDLQGMRLRISGRDQGRILERLGGVPVDLPTHEIYQALERGVIDGAEQATPGIDYAAGYHEITDYWATPGWHQTATVIGMMINKDAWDSLTERQRAKLRRASEAALFSSLGYSERRAVEGTRAFQEAGTTITRLPDDDFARVQEVTNEVVVESSCANPLHAKVYHSQLSFLQEYEVWRELSQPFGLGRSPEIPDMQAIEACLPEE